MPRRLTILRFIMTLFLLPIILILLSMTYTYITDPMGKEYRRLKDVCGDELWASSIVQGGSGMDSIRLTEPYPLNWRDINTRYGTIQGFGCSHEEAVTAGWSNYNTSSDFATYVAIFIAGVVFASPIIVGLIIWWIFEEIKYWR